MADAQRLETSPQQEYWDAACTHSDTAFVVAASLLYNCNQYVADEPNYEAWACQQCESQPEDLAVLRRKETRSKARFII